MSQTRNLSHSEYQKHLLDLLATKLNDEGSSSQTLYKEIERVLAQQGLKPPYSMRSKELANFCGVAWHPDRVSSAFRNHIVPQVLERKLRWPLLVLPEIVRLSSAILHGKNPNCLRAYFLKVAQTGVADSVEALNALRGDTASLLPAKSSPKEVLTVEETQERVIDVLARAEELVQLIAALRMDLGLPARKKVQPLSLDSEQKKTPEQISLTALTELLTASLTEKERQSLHVNVITPAFVKHLLCFLPLPASISAGAWKGVLTGTVVPIVVVDSLKLPWAERAYTCIQQERRTNGGIAIKVVDALFFYPNTVEYIKANATGMINAFLADRQLTSYQLGSAQIAARAFLRVTLDEYACSENADPVAVYDLESAQYLEALGLVSLTIDDQNRTRCTPTKEAKALVSILDLTEEYETFLKLPELVQS